MLFLYKTINKNGEREEGSIEAFNMDIAITSLQGKGLAVSSIKPKDEYDGDILKKIPFFNRVTNKEIVASGNDNPALRKHLLGVVDDLQGGASISSALSKHPDVFSDFYVNMIKSGEESGHIDQTFLYLADYLDRTYAVSSKAKNALIYPAFVIFTFISVMILMFTVIVSKIAPEKHYAASRLAELSLIVDTRGAYRGERGDSEVKVERE